MLLERSTRGLRESTKLSVQPPRAVHGELRRERALIENDSRAASTPEGEGDDVRDVIGIRILPLEREDEPLGGSTSRYSPRR